MLLFLSVPTIFTAVRRFDICLRSRDDGLDARAVHSVMYEYSTSKLSCGRLIARLDGTRDLVDLIMNPSVYHEASRFSYLLEHSLLLGDVCPVVPDFNP